MGRGEVKDAARLEKNGVNRLSLDHIVKERYPTFIDALRDLDDALSLLFLFANLPSTSTVPPKTIALCQRLCLEFQHYLIISHSLRKSFLSIKGIYYQATIQGQDILWLVPYKFVQRVTGDVDFRIMGTFVEFYTTLLGFVNFRLYTSIGLVYPPKFNAKSDEQGGELGAFTLEGNTVAMVKRDDTIESGALRDGVGDTIQAEDIDLQKRVDAITAFARDETEPESFPSDSLVTLPENAVDEFEPSGAGADVLPQPQISNSEVSTLFNPFTFFLSRETPRQPLEFLLKAFGCKRVGWDAVLGDGAFTQNETDPAITHQIVDRPPLPVSNEKEQAPVVTDASRSQNLPAGCRVPGRIYVQPQWVWDCINGGKLLRPDLYSPGTTLPPHLSPWMKPTKGAYDPSVPLAEQEREGEAQEFSEEEAEAAALEAEIDDNSDRGNVEDDEHELMEVIEADSNGMRIADSDESDSSEGDEDEFDGFGDLNDHGTNALTGYHDEAEMARQLYQAELEAEAAGLAAPHEVSVSANGEPPKGILKGSNGPVDEARRRRERKRREEEEELQRRMGMMSRKKRKLLEKMMYGKQRGTEEAEALRKKRRKLERGSGGMARV